MKIQFSMPEHLPHLLFSWNDPSIALSLPYIHLSVRFEKNVRVSMKSILVMNSYLLLSRSLVSWWHRTEFWFHSNYICLCIIYLKLYVNRYRADRIIFSSCSRKLCYVSRNYPRRIQETLLVSRKTLWWGIVGTHSSVYLQRPEDLLYDSYLLGRFLVVTLRWSSLVSTT